MRVHRVRYGEPVEDVLSQGGGVVELGPQVIKYLNGGG